MTVLDDLRAAGFSDTEVRDYATAQRGVLAEAGFSAAEIAAELGAPEFDDAAVRRAAETSQAISYGATFSEVSNAATFNEVDEGIQNVTGPKPIGDRNMADQMHAWVQSLDSGYQHSVTGLMSRGELPEPGKDPALQSMGERLAFQVGMIGGDIPAMIGGAVTGGAMAIGGGQAGPQAALPEELLTVPAMMAAGGMAVPEGMREALMQAYEKGEVVSWGDFFERSASTTWATMKGWITGWAGGKASEVAAGAAKLPAEIAALTLVGAGMEGRVPEAQEFIDAAVLIGGLKASATVATKLRRIYAKTGRRPLDVIEDAKADPEIAAHLAGDKPGLPAGYAAEAKAGRDRNIAAIQSAEDALKKLLDDPRAFEKFKAERRDVTELAQVQVLIERLEDARLRLANDPPGVTRQPGRMPPALQRPKDRTFTQWVRQKGGISTSEPLLGDVRATLDKGMISITRKDGKRLDELGELALEDGWFAERPAVRDIIDLLAEDKLGDVWHPQSKARADLEYVRQLEREADELGVDPAGLDDKGFFAALDNARAERLREMDVAQRTEYIEQQYRDLGDDPVDIGGEYGKPITQADLQRIDAEIAAAEGTGGADRSRAGGSDPAGGQASAAAAAARGADAEPALPGLGKPGVLDAAAAERVRGKIGLDPEITEPRLTPDVNKSVISAAEELLLEGNVTRDPSRLLSDQIMELLQTDRIDAGVYADVLKRHGVNADDFAQVWRADTRKAAQHLAELSLVERRLKSMMDQASPEDLKALREAGMDHESQMRSMWKRFDNVRRGLLVTQLSTAVRNFEVQVGRVGLDVLQKGLDAAIQRALPASKRNTHPADAFAAVTRMFQWGKTREAAEAVLSRFPKNHDDLFMRYVSDLTRGGKGNGAMAKAERAVWTLNAMNRFQEYAIRRPVFVAALEKKLSERGVDLETVIAKNRIGEISRDDVKFAVNEALEFTFSKDFDPAATGAEGIAGAFIRLINKMPGFATIPFPFPRFLMNAIKFQYEWSPAGFLHLLSKSERAAIAKGDTKMLSRAAIGTGMFYAAWEIRNSDYAGEKWWEIKTDNGETVSLLPFNPFVFHLFMADVAKRHKDGTLNSITSKDLAFGFLSSNFRAGAGLYILDAFMEALAGLGDEEKALEKIKGLGGEIAGGFLVPLQQVTDIYTEFDSWLGSGNEAILRDTRTEPFLGPLKSKIPLLSQTLPVRESPTRAEPMRRIKPTVKQLTGLGFRSAKNPAESELDRLGFTYQEIAPSSGNVEADRLIAKHMGPLVEQVASSLVLTPMYRQASNEVKGGLLREVMVGIRDQARDMAAAENPALFARLRYQRKPRRERRMIEDITGIRIPDVIDRAIDAQAKPAGDGAPQLQ